MANKTATQLLQAGYDRSATPRSIAVPIHQTTAYDFESTDEAAARFALAKAGVIYTRLTNPTNDVLEQRLAALDGGIGAIVTSCGQAAIATTLLTLLRSGDHVVASSGLYGGTYNLLSVNLPRFGITTTFVDSDDPADFAAAIQENTKIVYTETVGNPKLNVVDIQGLADVAHAAGIPLIVDNTITPYTIRPIEHGADLVVYSLSKYVVGNGTSLGGAVVDAGRFDWGSGKFPEFTEPHAGYHGLKLAEALGGAAFIAKLRIDGLRDLGSALSPFSAFQIIQSLETLPVRYARHSASALEVAKWLQTHPAVEWVNYPGLEDSPYYTAGKRYAEHGLGGVVTFGLKGGYEAAKKFADSVELFRIVANIGDSKSILIHPASTTHGQLTEAQQRTTGVTRDLIRLSIGLEDVSDIKADIEQAIAKVIG